MACNCIEVIDKLLAPKNTRLRVAITVPDCIMKPLVATEARETGRGKPKPIAMHPKFCPFCGVKFERVG